MFTKFLNDNNKQKDALNGSNSISYRVPSDYDRTPVGVLSRWDERLLDEDVARIMRMVYTPNPDNKFATGQCTTKDAHYSPPYSKIAREEFGYPTESATKNAPTTKK